jgi:hypothetical protein
MSTPNNAALATTDSNATDVINVATETTVAVQPAANEAAVPAPSVKFSEGIRTRLTGLANEAADWESTVYTTANEGLYMLIQQCYQLYKDLTDTADVNLKYKKQGLADYLAMNGMSAYESKSLPQKIIRCVFGDRDRRRISTYNVALRVIITQNWAVADVPAKIAEYGGVQEMSLGRKPGELTAKEKAGSVASAVQATELARVKTADTDRLANPEKVGDKFAAVLTLEQDGSFSINCIVESNAAITAALASFYTAQKAAQS